MDAFNLLGLSSAGKKYRKKVKSKINICKPWLGKINAVLLRLNSEQENIVRKNFQSINNVYQLLDKIPEILVAYIFLSEEPIFFEDNQGKPDIYLQKTDKYIEVKRLNISDEQKEIFETLDSNPDKTLSGNSSDKLDKQELMKQGLLRKAKDHINKAVKQIGSNKGIIFLLYWMDLNHYIDNLKDREIEFKKEINLYFKELKKENIELEIIQENELFFS